MRAVLLIIFFLPAITGHPQKVIDVSKTNLPNTSGLFYTVGGSPVSNYKYVAVVAGSPYFNESWMRGAVIMSGGFRYDNIFLRLDLLENALHYISPDGQEMIATSPIRSIILSDSVTGKTYQFDNSVFMQTIRKIEPGWYQLLDTGQARIYKRFSKVISENKAYGSSLTEQKINTFGNYFLMVNSVFTPIKKIKELPDMLQNKKDELKTYISIKNLTGKTDADYAALISYYNSLVGK